MKFTILLLLTTLFLSTKLAAQSGNAPKRLTIPNDNLPLKPNLYKPTAQDFLEMESHKLPKIVTDSVAKATTEVKKDSSSELSFKIGIIMPFDYNFSAWKIYGLLNDKDQAKGDAYKIKEVSKDCLDLYEGIQYALATTASHLPVELYVYDTYGNDSILHEILLNDTLKSCQIIIGSTTTTQAKIVASYCKKNKIVNLQPSVASKGIAMENPYLVRLMPTIDAHLQKIFETVIDTFVDDNIIVYTTKRERDLSAAKVLDTLFKSYNAVNKNKLHYFFVNSGDTTMPVARRNYGYYLSSTNHNVVIMTCYDETLVNSVIRGIGSNTTLFGMPTWIDAEQIRPDYLSQSQPYFTDNFYADTSLTKVNDFVKDYHAATNQKPTRYCYMGYDLMTYLLMIKEKYNDALIDGLNKESFNGMGYDFHISPLIKSSHAGSEPTIQYYTNTAMRLFQISDYKVSKVR